MCALLKVYFRKGKVLHDAGFLGDALQLFLQCLALDEDFAPAKLQVEKVIGLPIIMLSGSAGTHTVFLMLIGKLVYINKTNSRVI